MKNEFTIKDTQKAKAVAIILMLIHHCFLGEERWKGYEVSFFPLGQDMTVKIAQFGKICVGIFVFLSGYGMFISWKRFMKNQTAGCLTPNKAQTQSFIVRRLCKLMFGYWFIFIVFELFGMINTCLPIGRQRNFMTVYGTSPKSVLYFITDFLGLADLFETPTFNGTWWYMSLAIVLILIFPLCAVLYERFGFIVMLAAPLVPQYFGLGLTDLSRYLLAFTLGIVCADLDVLARVKSYTPRLFRQRQMLYRLLKAIVYTAVLVLLYKARQYDGGLRTKYIEVFDGLIPAFVVLYTYEVLADLPVVKTVLQYIGRYATEIFLLHTFFRAYFFPDLVYKAYYAPLIILDLLAVSLLCSIVLDKFKKLIRYDRLSKWTTNKILLFINKEETPAPQE